MLSKFMARRPATALLKSLTGPSYALTPAQAALLQSSAAPMFTISRRAPAADAKRFFSSQVDTDESAASLDAENDGESADRGSFGRVKKPSEGVTGVDHNVQSISAQIERGILDNLNEFQFMAYVQRVARSFIQQRDIDAKTRFEQMDAFCSYLCKRMTEVDQEPIYIHEVANFIYTQRNRYGRIPPNFSTLQREYANAVARLFKGDMSGARREYQEMSLYRFCIVLQGLSPQSVGQ